MTVPVFAIVQRPLNETVISIGYFAQNLGFCKGIIPHNCYIATTFGFSAEITTRYSVISLLM